MMANTFTIIKGTPDIRGLRYHPFRIFENTPVTKNKTNRRVNLVAGTSTYHAL